MRRLIAGLGIVTLAVVFIYQFSENDPVLDTPLLEYSLTYEIFGEEPFLLVSLRFPGDSDGSTWLALPDAWGGQTELYTALHTLEVHGDDAMLVPTDRASLYEIHHAPGANVHVTYRLIDQWDGPPEPFHGNPYRPIIDTKYLHLIGWAVWALPQWDDWPGQNPDVEFALDWSGLPEGWSVADNFGVGRELRQARGELNRLQAGLLVAGDFRVATFDVDGAPVNLAIRGEWSFGDAAFMEALVAVIRSQRTFWREESTDAFLVTLLPQHRREGQEGAQSNGGTGLIDAFALFSTTNMELRSFDWLTAHEFQHRWIPSDLGEVTGQEEEIYWFSEGFTDYYASLLSLRAGIIDLQGYADQINEAIQAYHRSPARRAPVADVVTGFWSDRDLQKLPYLRGRLIAARWNAWVKQETNGEMSLDDAMHDMQSLASIYIDQGGLSIDSTSVAWAVEGVVESYQMRHDPLFIAEVEALREQGRGSIIIAADSGEAGPMEGDLDRFVVAGEMVPVEQGMFGPCFDIRETEFTTFDLGFDLDATSESYIFAGVTEAGPAYAAGLRNGWQVTGWSFQHNDPASEVVLQVIDTATQTPQEIRYLPQGANPEFIPQLFLDDELSDDDRAACLTWLGAS